MKVELVTNLKRQATKILADLHQSKEPVLITEHVQPSAYLVDVQDYEFMQRRLELLEGLSRGERAVLEVRTYS
ncbi:type II toxin-antitoxin system prevent-host-death family antitoxin [Nitrincola tibetensis]|uniref:Antitoxin n=1 Tax=Nitrincola tibetensis TaxID=2219697 RepID=A0A364NL21_9GAMM|nr:type II toxin-antitoxin system Phd/YefM family antitoxin [Nitrincola tibetensis]RAU17575.1 type II toxin-antitoxin system prevent-host-death family antitoxin [Nitrincola tibetensis]